uniref:Uncharacterized protein n=1 Tax=Plectus sambesii TaxID=2011161 RepID=A0A914WB49_9BILA
MWKDELLTWDPKLFNGTDYIKVPASKVWLPDIVVESSSLEPEYFMSQDDRVVLITSDGTVYLSFPFVLTNYCKMNIKEYPFDTQQCTIKIMSWVYVKEEITLQSGTLAIDADMPRNNNTVWDILPYVVETFDLEVENVGTFRELRYRQKIKRKPQYYVWVLIVPTFILTALSLAGLYSPFNNAGEREEKVTLGLTTLLTLAVILTMVTGDMPRGSELPVMGLFVLLEIIMIVVSMAISVLTMFLHQRTTTRSCSVPHWLKSILFCHVKATGKVADEQQAAFDKTRHDSLTLDVPFYSSSQATSHQAFLLRACLRQLNGTYAKVDGWLNKNEEEEQRKHDWQLVFDWLDLSLFLIFQLIHIIAFILMFYPYSDSLN